MKMTQYITVDVSCLCKYCGYPIDALTHHCTHCTIAEMQNGLDIIAEKALWSDDCFSKDFHTDFIYTSKFKELPYIKFQKIECAKFHQYKNIFGVAYLHYDEVTYNTKYYCGYVDDNSNIVIPIIYENLGNFTEIEIVPAKLNNKYGMIDIQNKIVIPFEYDYLGDFHEGLAQYKQGKQRGYININGQKVINLSSSCHETYDFKKGQAKVGMWMNGECLYGFIDHTGEFIIPPVYHSAQEYGEYYRVGKKFAHDFLIDRQGFEICKYGTEQQITLPLDKYYIYGNICGDLIEVARYYKATSYSENDKLLWGVITRTHKEIVPLEYERSHIKLIDGNYVLVNDTNNNDYSSNKHYWTSIIGSDGKRLLLPTTCISVEYISKHHVFKIKTETTRLTGLARYEDGKIRTIVPLQFEQIYPFWKRHAKYQQFGMWGILSHETGKITVHHRYHEIIKQGDLIYVRRGKQYGFFSPNYNADILSYTPCSAQDWESMLQRKSQKNETEKSGLRGPSFLNYLGWKYFKSNGLMGIISINTMQIVIPPIYDSVQVANPDDSNRPLIIFMKKYENSYGLMDTTHGVLLTPCIHGNIDHYDHYDFF